ncbi:hypothetical protein [Kitasatospora albolonga]|uniref:hypothetical protein n=1 Tax=Kitasatospora albolonga TaxID=68173 RepID=UPI0031EF0BB7
MVQAKEIHGDVWIGNPERVVRSAARGIRAATVLGACYRAVASLVGCAALAGFGLGSDPVTQLGRMCQWAGLPWRWTLSVEHWTQVRAEALGGVGLLLLLGGLLTLPAPHRFGGDIGAVLRWRGPSTAVVGAVLMLQCQASFASWVSVAVTVGAVAWIRGRSTSGGYDSMGQVVAVAVIAPILAAGFLPLLAVAMLLGRDDAEGPDDWE